MGAEHPPRAGLGERADADHAPRPQQLDAGQQRRIARGEQRRALLDRQLVRRAVFTARLHEGERAEVHQEEAPEEGLGRVEVLLGPVVDARARDLAARAVEPQHGAIGVLRIGLLHGLDDAQPVAHATDVAEGYAGLRHTPGAGVHAEQQRVALATRERLARQLQVALV